MTALVLFPIAISVLLTGGALAWPLAYRAGANATFDRDLEYELSRRADEQPRSLFDEEGGYHGRHRMDVAIGSATQVRRLAALRQPTEEFHAIVAASYRSGELPVIAP